MRPYCFAILFSAFALFCVGQQVVFAQDVVRLKKPTLQNRQLSKIKEQSKAFKQPKPNVAVTSLVRQVQIKGLETFTESFVRQKLSFKKGDIYKPVLLKTSVSKLNSTGFFQSVESKVIKTDKGVVVRLNMIENPRVGAIEFRGVVNLPPRAFFEVLQTKEGKVYSTHQIRKDIQRIKSLYEDEGFLFAVVYQVDKPKKSGDPLVFYIAEGLIDEIKVTGYTKTKPYVIRRELFNKVGMPIRKQFIKRDLRRLKNLNYFKQVKPNFLDGKDRYTKKMVFDVEEKPTRSINLGGGYGERSGLFFFSDVTLDNLFGTGQLVKLKSQFGQRSTTFNFKYHNPWMWDNRKSLTFDFWHSLSESIYIPTTLSSYNNRATFDQQRTGFQYALGLPVTYDWGTTHALKVEDIKDLPFTYNDESYEEYLYNIRAYTAGIYYDTRDYRLNPLSGRHYTLSVEKALRLSSLSLDYTKVVASAVHFFPTFKKQTIAFRLMGGQLYAEDRIRETESFFVGGPSTVRGYEGFPNSFAYGKQMLVSNLEYRFLFNDSLTAMLFVDAGWATTVRTKNRDKTYSYSDDKVEDAKIGKGLSFLLFSPLGPLRLDFAWDERSDFKMDFSFGPMF